MKQLTHTLTWPVPVLVNLLQRIASRSFSVELDEGHCYDIILVSYEEFRSSGHAITTSKTLACSTKS